jgi:hypothetical protein
MPLYFFHLHDSGEWLIDPEGIEVLNEAAVAAKALEQARDVIAADVLQGDLDLESAIAVENETGTVVHFLRFSDAVTITQPPAELRLVSDTLTRNAILTRTQLRCADRDTV